MTTLSIQAYRRHSVEIEMTLEPLHVQLRYHLMTFKVNTADVDHQESMRAPAGGGNCMNWIVGHLVDTRRSWMRLLGVAPVWADGEGAIYGRGSERLTDPHEARDFEALTELFTVSQAPIVGAMLELDDSALLEPAPFSPGNDPNETVGSLLAGLVFHEAYHIGQLGLLRQTLGKSGLR